MAYCNDQNTCNHRLPATEETKKIKKFSGSILGNISTQYEKYRNIIIWNVYKKLQLVEHNTESNGENLITLASEFRLVLHLNAVIYKF